jgi:hypothetical protein
MKASAGILLCICAALGAAVVEAQVAGGPWIEYHPTHSVQLRGAHTAYQDTGGIESFSMERGDERCEARVNNEYKTGVNQFEGYVRVTSGQGTSVHQIFKFLMIVAYPQNGGELHQHSQTFLTNGAFGKWVRVNTIHYTATHEARVYIDGQLKTTMRDVAPSDPDGWYNKYGVYNTNNGSKSEWRDVRYWKQGTGSDAIISIGPAEAKAFAASVPVYDLRGQRVDARPERQSAGPYFIWKTGAGPVPGP